MGCTPFGEQWNKGTDDLLLEASNEAFASAGVTKDGVDAYWLGTAFSGMSGMALARPLQLHDKPVTHVENFCATGSEALRNAAYAVASGAYDMAMAVGVEKVKDSGYQGLVGAAKTPTEGTGRTLTAAAMLAMCSPGYGKKYGLAQDQIRELLAQRRSRVRLHDLPRDRRDRPRRVRAGRHHEPARATRDGGSARLLHAGRAADLRRPRFRRTRHRVEGSARRHLRPRGRVAG